jgi:RNA polymerase sigma factor (sigma-70 family)
MNEQQIEKLNELILKFQTLTENLDRNRTFNDINKMLSPRLEEWIRQYSKKNTDEFNRLKQEVLIGMNNKIIPKIKVIKGSSCMPYIEKSVKNLLKSDFRKEKSEHRNIVTNIKCNESGERVETDPWDNVNTCTRTENHADLIINQLELESCLQRLKDAGFDNTEMEIMRIHYPKKLNGNSSVYTNVEIAKKLDITEQKVQRTIIKFRKILKNYSPEKKNKDSQSLSVKKQKKVVNNQKVRELNTIDIAYAFNRFDPERFHIAELLENNRLFYVEIVDGKIGISFDSSGDIILELIPPEEIPEPGKLLINEYQSHAHFYNKVNSEKLNSPKDLIEAANLLLTFALEPFIRYYAPKKTEKEMRDFLKEIGRYKQTRKYITRYKGQFKPSI